MYQRIEAKKISAIFKIIFLNEKCCILIQISLRYVSKDLIVYLSALVRIMVWQQEGNKPLSWPMMTHFADDYMRHLASVSKHGLTEIVDIL